MARFISANYSHQKTRLGYLRLSFKLMLFSTEKDLEKGNSLQKIIHSLVLYVSVLVG